MTPNNAPQHPLDPAKTIIWEPMPGPQTALISCPVFEVFFGGARGGGKTEGSIGDWLLHSATYGEDASGIFVRKRFKQLADVIKRTKRIFTKLGAKYNEQRAEWKMANGATLRFVYLERDSDAEEYQGHSYTRIYIEEVTNFATPLVINKLKACLRSDCGVPCGMRLTGNPGGPGHGWVKKRYIDPAPEGYKILTEVEEIEWQGQTITIKVDRVFIPSKIVDNTRIMTNDPGYILRLRGTGSESLVRAWLQGDWDIIDGAFFHEWDDNKHVLDMEWLERVPKDAVRFRSLDWGSYHPFSVGWYVVSDGTWGLPKGALLKYREWYGAIEDNRGLKMDVPLVAQGILEREKGERIRYGVADPAIFIHDGGPSIAETFAINKVAWRRADNKRFAGAEMMHMRLTGEEDPNEPGTFIPMLYFLSCCEDSIRTIPLLQHDTRGEGRHVEDVDTQMEDHAYDETRYAVMSRPWVPRSLEAYKMTLPKLPSQYTINELIELNAKKRRLRAAEESL